LTTDLIVGMAAGYTWQTLQPFVLSLSRSGYKGRCVLILGDGRKEETGDCPGYAPTDGAQKGYIHPVDATGDRIALCYKLLDYGVEPCDIGSFTEHPIMARFPIIADIIDRSGSLRYVLSVDTKDVIFQYDPTTWLEQHLGDKQVCVVSEGTTYQQSLGNANNCRAAFGDDKYELMKDNMVLNAGVIAGVPSIVSRLHRDIYALTATDKRGGQPGYSEMVADQTAMNILLRLDDRYRDTTFFATHRDGFVAEFCHLHYSWVNGKRKFERHLVEQVENGQRPDLPLDEYNFHRDEAIYPGGSTKPFAINHQYTNNGDWWVELKEKYQERE
jgi:hypothetical protein